VNLTSVEEIAKAVLYEGYMLYPYRPSSVKNRQRFNFGALCPQSYCEHQSGSESSFMHTECLLRTTSDTRLMVRLGFLQIVERRIGRLDHANMNVKGYTEAALEFVDRLEFGGRTYQPWREATERSFTCDDLELDSLSSPRAIGFNVPESDSFEWLHDAEGREVGSIVRQSKTLNGSLTIGAQPLCDGIVKVSAQVNNRSELDPDVSLAMANREAILPFAFLSAHLILGVENGEFISLLDPPAEYAELAAQCENQGAWPVLAGDNAETVLASSIILYDYPKIAPESVGNLFDATEIDEILSLRILTLTDQEKEEIRQSDHHARELLERTESIPNEQFMKLHGVLRGLTPFKGARG
jgi:hydrogenase maturation protease